MSEDTDLNDESELTSWQIGLIVISVLLFLLYFFRGYVWSLFGTSKSDTLDANPEWLADFAHWRGPGFRTAWLKQPPVFKWW